MPLPDEQGRTDILWVHMRGITMASAQVGGLELGSLLQTRVCGLRFVGWLAGSLGLLAGWLASHSAHAVAMLMHPSCWPRAGPGNRLPGAGAADCRLQWG